MLIIRPHYHNKNSGFGNKLLLSCVAESYAIETEQPVFNWLVTDILHGGDREGVLSKDNTGLKWRHLPNITVDDKEASIVGEGTNLSSNQYHQAPNDIELIKKYKNLIVKDFGEEDGVFVHVRLGDLKRHNRLDWVPTYDYYKKCLLSIPTNDFKVGYIASDSPDDPLVLKLALEFGLQIYQDTPENTIIFGSKFNTKVLSLGTFSWWIGFIGNQNNVMCPNLLDFSSWHGPIFEAMEGWNSVSKDSYKKPIIVKDGSKKIISFSLYGNKPNFQVGAVLNVLEAKRLYPDWKCRFYTTDDEGICKQLEYLGAEIVRMDDHWLNQGHHYGSLWRFLAVDDAHVCIFRDTDSVVNERELGAVNEWLDSDYQWHIMHDHKHHKSKIMAGMFGYRHHDECNIPESLAQKSVSFFDFQKKESMLQLIKDWLNGSVNTSKSFDQKFLAAVIHPKIKNNFLSHGVYGQLFPEHAPCRYGNFVGDYSFWAGGWKEFVNGDKKSTSVPVTPPPKAKHDRVLDRVIVSCDSHPNYLDFWTLAVSAWKKIDVKATLVLIEKSDENIEVDETIGDVIRLKLEDDSVHTAFAAQAVRLLAPCLYPDENIIIADVDIMPLSKEYFFNNLCRGPEDSFIEYRRGCVGGDQVAMCWNVAKGSVWGDIFNIEATMKTYSDVFINRLKEWNPQNYKPISKGLCNEWFTDQRLLYKYLSEWSGQHVKLTDAICKHRRLDHRVRHPDTPNIYHTDFCPRRPVKHNLAYKGRPDLDNSETIKNVFDWYNIPWRHNDK